MVVRSSQFVCIFFAATFDASYLPLIHAINHLTISRSCWQRSTHHGGPFFNFFIAQRCAPLKQRRLEAKQEPIIIRPRSMFVWSSTLVQTADTASAMHKGFVLSCSRGLRRSQMGSARDRQDPKRNPCLLVAVEAARGFHL
jgi:hypothetical protein